MPAHHERLRSLSGNEFESFVADLWEARGWDATVTQASNDRGVDVRAVKTGPIEQTQLIQAKCYGPTTSVGSPDIQQYASLNQQDSNADSVVVVSTGSATEPARNLAADLNVKLVVADELDELIEDSAAADLVDEYVGAKDPAPSNGSTAGEASAQPTTGGGEDDTAEMTTGEAITAVVQLLLVLALFGTIVFVLVTGQLPF